MAPREPSLEELRLTYKGRPPPDSKSSDTFVDSARALFIEITALKDWVTKSDVGITSEDVALLEADVPEVKVCREVANNAKHLTPQGPTIEGISATVMGAGVGAPTPHLSMGFRITGNLDALSVAETAVGAWRNLLQHRGLQFPA